MARRKDKVTEAFARFRTAASRVLGAGEILRDRATRDQVRALAAYWLRKDGIDALRAEPAMAPALGMIGGAVAEAERERAEAFRGWLGHGPRELTDLVAETAPGAAGAVGAEWMGLVPRPGEATETQEGIKGVPELWRIGTGRLDIGAEFPVAVPLLDESHLRVDSRPDARTAAELLVEQLVMRLLSTFRPGVVHVDLWDGSQYGLFPALHPLASTGLVTSHDPDRLDDLLDELSERIRRIHSRVLVEGALSLREHTVSEGARSEPWVVVVLAGNRTALPDEQQRRLQRIARSGPDCGIQLVLLDLPITVGAACETVRLDVDAHRNPVGRCSMSGAFVPFRPDDPLPRAELTTAARHIADVHREWQATVRTFEDLRPRPTAEPRFSASHLGAPIGFDRDGGEVELLLSDSSPHALIGGPSGSGKTNLLLAMIGSLAARYGPDELHFYLLDFKEGVSFAPFAPGRSDGRWLPHAQMIGINVNTDREYGLAVLQFLTDEMRRRAEVAKRYEVSKLEELRALKEPPEGPWPRIVAVIDEFQFLFSDNDALTKRAVNLLEDVARRGRSQGIHLVLASQDVGGIDAFWGRPGIFEQFVLRIALPRARRVLANLNEAALALPRWHAVVNHESGVKHANEIARIPDAGSGSTVSEVQRGAWETERERRAETGRPFDPPIVFDGAKSPAPEPLVAALGGEGARAVVGQAVDMAGSAAVVPLPDRPGRNLAVLGAGEQDAHRVLATAALALARTHPDATFLVAPLVGDAGVETVLRRRAVRQRAGAEAADAEAADAAEPDVEVVPLAAFKERIESLAAVVKRRASSGDHSPVHLLIVGADAADPLLERSGTEALRTVIRFGPEVGVHVVGWWRSATRLKQLLALSASVDDMGAWIALDVQGADLLPFAPSATVWAPRPGRGLFFDRAQHARPEVVIVPGPVPDE